MRLAWFTLIAIQLTSCVGGGLVLGKKEEHAQFGINATRSKPMRSVTAGDRGTNPTRGEVRSSWGEPDRQTAVDGGEQWSYRSGLAVRGVIPMIGIGIPLVIPVGRNHYEFQFTEGSDRASKLIENSNQLKGGFAGLNTFSESSGFGFHTLGE